MLKLFHVIVEYDAVVLAEEGKEAIDETKKAIYDADLDFSCSECVEELKERKYLPFAWNNEEPLNGFYCDEEEFFGTCSQIFDRIEARLAEEKRLREIWEENDKKQLKFPFYEEMNKSDSTPE